MKYLVTLLFGIAAATPVLSQTTPKYDSLELLVTGEISAYRSKTQRFYIERNDTLIHLPKTKEDFIIKDGVRTLRTTYPFRGLLNYYLQSCKKATSAVMSLTALTDADLISVMKKYNECSGQASTFVEDKSERRSVVLGVVGGINFATLKIATEDAILLKSKSNTSSKPAMGVFFEYNSLKYKFGFGTQVNYTSYQFNTRYQEENGVQYIDDLTEVDLTQFQAQIFFKKWFGTSDFHGYVKTGPSLTFTTAEKAFRETSDTEKSGLKRTFVTTTDPYFETSNRLNLFLGIGVTKTLGAKLLGSLEVRGEYANSFSKLDGHFEHELSSNPITIYLGVAYRL
jgi:hypothetical protein